MSRLSVRARLALAVGLLTSATLAAVAILAPNLVEDSLRTDLLEAEADAALSLVTFDGDAGFDAQFVVDETGALVDVADIEDLDGFGIEGFEIVPLDSAEALRQRVSEQILLLRGVDRFDDLVAAAGGTFAISTSLLGNGYATVAPDGTFTVADGELESIGVPIMTEFEVDELLFDDLGLFEPTPGSFVNTQDDASLIIGVSEIDGIDVLVAADASSVDRSVSRVRSALWIGVPILTLLVAAIAWILASRSLRPVRSITDQAATISGGTLDSRVPVPATGDEIAVLATTVNEMLDRLEDDDHRRRRFISDASHELRSPVAVMRNEAEVALAHPDRADAGELAAAISVESRRMAVIIDDLLTLARHDEGTKQAASDVDLDDIVLAEASRTRRVEIDTTQVSAGRVTGRGDELERLVGHLLDNAARHAESTVSVSLGTEDRCVVLRVDDDGAGIAPADRERVFERFARLDEARSRDRGGAGLGLAVVAGLAERNGGSVTVDDSDLGGARFVVRFGG